MSDPLEFTGERFTPECVREIWYEHFHRYAFAGELVAGKRVLDAACGEGYGAAYLAGKARSVTGVDISNAAIVHACSRYPAENLEFLKADCCALPFEDGEFDCIVSFETLEHLENQAGLLKEFRRVLDPVGFLLISSPDKAVYSDGQQHDNEFHVRELYRDEFLALIEKEFPHQRLFKQKLLFQSAIWSSEPVGDVTLQHYDEVGVSHTALPVHEAMYFIALCAAEPDCLPITGSRLYLFDDADESVYRHYQHEIGKNMAAGKILQDRDREISELKNALKARAKPVSGWRRWLGLD